MIIFVYKLDSSGTFILISKLVYKIDFYFTMHIRTFILQCTSGGICPCRAGYTYPDIFGCISPHRFCGWVFLFIICYIYKVWFTLLWKFVLTIWYLNNFKENFEINRFPERKFLCSATYYMYLTHLKNTF